MKEINVMGTTYTIEFKDEDEDKKLNELEGYTDLYAKQIVICNLKSRDYYKNVKEKTRKKAENKVLRHEIVHAFLYESGLDCNSNKSYSWAENEEMIDWIAIQSPKLFNVFIDLEILQ